jgi:GntR family transcriptional regulator
MSATIRVSQKSDIPIYRQIVMQLTFMIEMGQLVDGERLPGSRMLGDNLGINRNTVAHAYGELRRLGLVEARGRNGMVVVGGAQARTTSAARDRARDLLAAAARECIELGLTPPEIQDLVTNLAVLAAGTGPTVAFVECNVDRATSFAHEIEQEVGIPVRPLVLGRFEAAQVQADLVLTTFFHLAEVRGLLRGPSTDVVALVVGPHIQTLVEIASVPKGQRVGIRYHTEEQAASVRDSLAQAGVTNVEVLDGTEPEHLSGIEVVVIPSGMPELKQLLQDRVRVIEFGNVLDAASLRMVRDVVRDLRVSASRVGRGGS